MNQGRWKRLYDEPVFHWALGISALLSVAVGAEAVKSMVFVNPPNPLLVSHLTPLICAFAVTYCGVLRTNIQVPDRTEHRVRRITRYVFFTFLSALSCGLLWIWQTDLDNSITVLRNTLFLVGVSGLLNEVRPTLVWLAPLTYLAGNLLLGVDQSGEVRWWALVIQPVEHLATMYIAIGVWVINLVFVALKPRYAP